MPNRKTRRKVSEGSSPSAPAGEFVYEEIHPVREARHGVANPRQAISIGLSKARRAGRKD